MATPNRRPLSTISTNSNATAAPPQPPRVAAPLCTPSRPSNPYRSNAVAYSPPSTVKRHVTQISRHRWNVPELRPRQKHALGFIFYNKASKGTVLIVDKTGGGKSHIMRCSGVFTRGIVVVTVPLLALAADVFLKFVTDEQRYGSVDAIHFDEDIADDTESRKLLISDINSIPSNTDRTVFLFISPQRLHRYKDLRAALLNLHSKGTFRNLMLDEFHIFCQHGMDFRREIRDISSNFIRPLMARPNPPYLLACTATCSIHNIEAFRRASGVLFTPQHRLVSPPSVFQQRHIDMSIDITSRYKQSTSEAVLTFLAEQDHSSFVVYTNTAALAKQLHDSLRDSLDGAQRPVHILLIHGSQSTLEKFYYTRAFTDDKLQDTK